MASANHGHVLRSAGSSSAEPRDWRTRETSEGESGLTGSASKINPAIECVYLLFAAASGLTLLCLWPYLHSVGAFGPLVTYAEARRMPEFGPEGRVPFFFPSWWDSWVGGNGGIHNLPTRPPWFLAGVL